MLKKNIEKRKRAGRANQWTGYTPKATPTKKEKLKKISKKYKKPIDKDNEE